MLVASVVAFLLIVCGLVYCFYIRPRKAQRKLDAQEEEEKGFASRGASLAVAE